MKNYKQQAKKLFYKLQDNCNDRTICENYGQNAIRKFIDKISLEKDYNELSYSEQCNIKDILYNVSRITTTSKIEL